jgi:tRNA threonylcarbamoyladenosine biosynthesis protein TsaB
MAELLLAIDAATSNGGIAIGSGGAVRAEVGISDTSRHSELLLPSIEFALHACGATRSDLAGIVVGAGPGSFTGVRIAAATARGLAAALEIPLLAYSSLAALAASAGRGEQPVCALFDARRGEVYGACYAFVNGRVETIMAPMAGPIDDVVHLLGDVDAEFAGDGAIAYQARLPRPPLEQGLVYPRASNLLWLAHFDADAGAVASPGTFEPQYVRDSNAQLPA